jgi:ketosteroid isomerase-like protein
MSDKNVSTVQNIYGAFGRGDVPGILELVTDDTEWGYNGPSREVPWHPTYKGRANLPKFFQALMENLEMHDFKALDFKALDFIHSGEDVVAHIAIEYTVKKTGKRVKQEQLHWWSFKNGKAARIVHYEDTAQVVAAVRG